MSIRLCQDCCQWVSTRNGRCPDCQDALPETVNQDESDRIIRSAVGAVRGSMGHVRVPRRKLPTDGVLYETANGLFFLPYKNVIRRRMVEQSAASPLWTVASVLWAPLMFIAPFLRRREILEKDVVESEPIRLGEKDLQLLPDFLTRIPGAFFVSLRDVRTIKQKRNQWIIERSNRSPVTIQPVSDRPFAQEMQQFLDTRL